MIVLSLIIHGALLVYFEGHPLKTILSESQRKKKEPVKIKFVTKDKPRQILETPLKKTERPEKADFLGKEDHIAKKQTRAKNKKQRRHMDPGQGQETSPKPAKKRMASKDGTVADNRAATNSRYADLLPKSKDLKNNLAQGYQDYIDKDLPPDDYIDVNTVQSRWIGYFTLVRKAFDLAYFSPISKIMEDSELRNKMRRGGITLQGKPIYFIRLLRDGTIKEIQLQQSSGYKALDEHLYEVIKATEPFPNLPQNYEKDTLSFRVGTTYYIPVGKG